MRRPDSLNLVIKTWYYVSWGSNKYHQLYPVLIEQNKNLSDKTFPQAGILFWTVALSQCIGILVATISFRFECFLSRDFLELYQNWNLKISICRKSKMYHCAAPCQTYVLDYNDSQQYFFAHLYFFLLYYFLWLDKKIGNWLDFEMENV